MSIEAIAQEILDSLPKATKDRAESIRAAGERERWESGDLSLELVDELYPIRPKAAIRLAVAILYHCSEGTIRDRERVCRLVSPTLRNTLPIITYHFWRACSMDPPNMIDYAYQIEGYQYAYDKLPSVGQVYAWVKGDNGKRELMSRVKNKVRLR